MKSDDRKPHARSWLKNLPETEEEALAQGRNPDCTQDAIMGLVQAEGATLDGVARHILSEPSYACPQTQDGLSTALGLFRKWWLTRRRNSLALEIAREKVEQRAKLKGMTQREKDEAVMEYFQDFALAKDDAELWGYVTQVGIKDRDSHAGIAATERKIAQKDLQIAQKDEEIAVMKARFRRDTCELFVKWAADEKAKAIIGSSGTNAEKIEALGQQMFGDDWNE